MTIVFDPGKRQRVLFERGLDFEDAQFVFDAPHFEVGDTRRMRKANDREKKRIGPKIGF